MAKLMVDRAPANDLFSKSIQSADGSRTNVSRVVIGYLQNQSIVR